MNTKYLKKIRKYWDYRFKNGKVYTRRKVDGEVREYTSIRSFLYWMFDDLISERAHYRWGERWNKRRDTRLWKSLNERKQQ